MASHTVAQGECLSQIAWKYGFRDYTIVWDDPANAELRKKRVNPNVLLPGDVIFIPAHRAREAPVAVDRRHLFRLGAPQKELRIVFKTAEGQTLGHEPYVITLADAERIGATDSEGALKERVPLALTRATVRIDGRTLQLSLHHLDPLPSPEQARWTQGILSRLVNLGYVSGDVPVRAKAAALALFQRDHGLDVTGEPDERTLRALIDHHGS